MPTSMKRLVQTAEYLAIGSPPTWTMRNSSPSTASVTRFLSAATL